MERKVTIAVFLTLVMLLSGCLGSGEPVTEDKETEEVIPITASLNSILTTGNPSVGEISIIEGIISVNPDGTDYYVESDIITPTGLRSIDTTLSDTNSGTRLILMPDEPGEWMVNLRLVVDGLDEPVQSSVQFTVLTPSEGDTIISTESIIEVDDSAPLTISGKVIHTSPESCTVTDGANSQEVGDNGEFSINQGVVEDSYNVTITAICGIWTKSEDSRLVKVILASITIWTGMESPTVRFLS